MTILENKKQQKIIVTFMSGHKIRVLDKLWPQSSKHPQYLNHQLLVSFSLNVPEINPWSDDTGRSLLESCSEISPCFFSLEVESIHYISFLHHVNHFKSKKYTCPLLVSSSSMTQLPSFHLISKVMSPDVIIWVFWWASKNTLIISS